jgi:transposase-like protein
MNLNDIAKNFSDEDKARAFLEAQRWPNGAVCPHCGTEGESYRLEPKAEGKTHVRPGVWKCGACRKQFTVRVGTIFEDSHIPLPTWLKAIHLLCASEKGMSSHQLHRMLGVTYKSAWFMAHRVRYALSQEPLSSKLKGTVEVDETYIGGKGRVRGRTKKKAMVVSLVERGGNVRSFHNETVTGNTLKQVVRKNVHPDPHIMTDDYPLYGGLRREFRRHSTIRHKWHVYARKEGDVLISTNTIEGYFPIIKRGINGVYHHVGKQHLHRYLSEFDFRYNGRHVSDGERCVLAIKGADGKRLMLRDSSAASLKNG